MTNIDLHNNRLTYLDINLFFNNSRLTTLLLSENKINKTQPKYFQTDWAFSYIYRSFREPTWMQLWTKLASYLD